MPVRIRIESLCYYPNMLVGSVEVKERVCIILWVGEGVDEVRGGLEGP